MAKNRSKESQRHKGTSPTGAAAAPKEDEEKATTEKDAAEADADADADADASQQESEVELTKKLSSNVVPATQAATTVTTETTREQRTVTSHTLWSKIVMGFAVCFLIGVLVRLIQLRAKRLRGLEGDGAAPPAQYGGLGAVVTTGGRCCYLSTTLSLLVGGLAMLFILFRARQAKEQQSKENLAWNVVAGVVLLLGIFILMEFSKLTHDDDDARGVDESGRGFTLWIYFAIAAAALASAKLTAKLMRPARKVIVRRDKSRESYFSGMRP